MQFLLRFQRRVRTSRRFVFENIMDLDHVCHLHKKWFGDLRPIVRRHDYVEYRLRSSFYGVPQDLLVRGAPLNRDRYWYEFLGPLARVRVDGAMVGPDGDLLLTESIAYRFSFWLAPIVWLIKPLLKRQKQDIFDADARLLERVYRLDREGFQRYELDGSRGRRRGLFRPRARGRSA